MSATPDLHMSCNTSSGEVTPRTASARVDRFEKSAVSAPLVGSGGHSPSTMTAASRWATERSPAPCPAGGAHPPVTLGRPPMQKTPSKLSIEHEPLTGCVDDQEGELLVVNFTPSKKDAAVPTGQAPATAASSPSTRRVGAKGEAVSAGGATFPSWTERRPSQVRPRTSSRASGRCDSRNSRGASPSSQQRHSFYIDEARDFDEQQRKFRIVRNLFASHEDGVRFCIVLDQLLAVRAIASQEFEERLKLLPKHEAARLRALKEKDEARRRAREDKIWDVENVVRRAVPTEPPAMLAKLFNKGTGTGTTQEDKKPTAVTAAAAAAAEKRKAAEAERAAQKEKDAMARKMADLEKALQEAQKDNADLKKDLTAAQEKNREADLVQSSRPTANLPRGGSFPASSPTGFNHDGDVWAAIEELRRAVAMLNQRVGTIEQREQMSLLDAIAQLRRDLQQLDQRAALMEGRQRAALGW